MRTTIKDIANHLGISVNTVSKALNGKSQISEKTRELVLKAAAEMDYSPNESARALVRKELRIAAVFPLEPHEFYQYMIEGIRKAARELADNKCTVLEYTYSSQENSEELRDVLAQVFKQKVDALVLTCGYRFECYRNELEQFSKAEIPILYNTIFGADLPGIVGGIRTDTVTAGRIAAEFLGMTIPPNRKKQVALLVGVKELLVYRECVEGFYSDAEKYGIEIVGVYETFGERSLAYTVTEHLLRIYPNLSGIYVAAHNATGVCDYLEENQRQDPLIVIGHDLYPALNQKLRKRILAATLFQNQYEYGKDSILMMSDYLIGQRSKEDCKKRIVPQLVFSSMVDSFPYYDRKPEFIVGK